MKQLITGRHLVRVVGRDQQNVFIAHSHKISGKLLHNYGESPFLMGNLTINGHVQSFFVNVYQAG